jgi:hypothetical protein
MFLSVWRATRALPCLARQSTCDDCFARHNTAGPASLCRVQLVMCCCLQGAQLSSRCLLPAHRCAFHSDSDFSVLGLIAVLPLLRQPFDQGMFSFGVHTILSIFTEGVSWGDVQLAVVGDASFCLWLLVWYPLGTAHACSSVGGVYTGTAARQLVYHWQTHVLVVSLLGFVLAALHVSNSHLWPGHSFKQTRLSVARMLGSVTPFVTYCSGAPRPSPIARNSQRFPG